MLDRMDEKLKCIGERYSELVDLFNKDPCFLDKQPHESKGAGMDILNEIEVDLNGYLKSDQTNKDLATIMLAVTFMNKGILHVHIEELDDGEQQFMKCLDFLKGRELDSEAVLIIIICLNSLGIIWSRWNQPEKALTFFQRAYQIYKNYTNKEDYRKVTFSIVELFGIVDTDQDLNCAKEEKIHTLTIYYLAQTYAILKDDKKSAMYYHILLKRALQEKEENSENFDYIEWALNATTLSHCFMKNEKFSLARHHLAAASYILQQYENILKEKYPDTESEKAAAEWERFRYRSADIARCWASYGLFLLISSKKRLMDKVEKEDIEQDDLQDTTESESDSKSEKELEELFGKDPQFDLLVDDIKPFVNQITDTYILDYNDARLVFLNIQKWLDQAKTYYTLDEHASEHVQIVQEMALMYKYLSFFEESEDRKAKMHKRRIDLLEDVVKKLNPRYYENVCMEIWLELGQAYTVILDIKLDRLETKQNGPDTHAVAKINHLANNAIDNYLLFVDSVDNRSTKNGDSITYSEDDVHPVLYAYFELGRLYCKIITSNKEEQLNHTYNSIGAYVKVIKYCESHPEVAEVMKCKLALCKEIMTLLPKKALKLERDIQKLREAA